MLEKTLESPLDSKEIRPVDPKGNQSWIFIRRTDAEAETPILWPPDAMNWLIWKDPHAGKDWRWEEKGTIEEEMVGWHHRLDGHEFEQTLGIGDGQGSLVCCSPWGSQRVGHNWEQLNWTEEETKILFFFQFTCIFKGFPCGLADKESACNVRDLGSIPGLGRSPGEGKGYPPQYSGLENSMDCNVHRVAKSRTQLGNFHFTQAATKLT